MIYIEYVKSWLNDTSVRGRAVRACNDAYFTSYIYPSFLAAALSLVSFFIPSFLPLYVPLTVCGHSQKANVYGFRLGL